MQFQITLDYAIFSITDICNCNSLFSIKNRVEEQSYNKWISIEYILKE